MKVSVDDFTAENIELKIPEKFKKYAPNVLKSAKCKLTISGCNNAIANGIRRTIACELPVKHLTCDYENIVTDDPFIIPEMIQKRLRMIPLLQSVPAGAKFELHIVNASEADLDVKTGDIKGGKYFDNTYTLLTLKPGRKLSIVDISVASNYGYFESYGMCTVAIDAVSVCKDMVPYDMYTGKGSHTHTADPKVWEISFGTNGTMSPKDILIAACNNIIERLKGVMSLLHTIVNNEDEYILRVYGESDTIGNLIMRTAIELYPDAEHVSYNVPIVERIATIKIKYNDDINSLYRNVIANIISTYESIRDQIE
jgi:DNA-directed RNA polymerase subunit L